MQTDLCLSSHDITRLLRILEAAEGLAVLKTLDGKKGQARLIYPAANEMAVDELLEAFAREHLLTINKFLK